MTDQDLTRAFFDATDAFCYIKDAEGRFLLVNRAGAAALGLDAVDCVGKKAADFVSPEEAEATEARDREAAASGRPINFKSVVNLPTGARTLLDHKFPLAIPDAPGATAGIVFDVTDLD